MARPRGLSLLLAAVLGLLAASARAAPACRGPGNTFTSLACMSNAMKSDGFPVHAAVVRDAYTWPRRLAQSVAKAAGYRPNEVQIAFAMSVPTSDDASGCSKVPKDYKGTDACGFMRCTLGRVQAVLGDSLASLVELGLKKNAKPSYYESQASKLLSAMAGSGYGCGSTSTPKAGAPKGATFGANGGGGGGFGLYCQLKDGSQINLAGGGGGGGAGYGAGASSWAGSGGSGGGANAVAPDGTWPHVGAGAGADCIGKKGCKAPAPEYDANNLPANFGAAMSHVVATRVPQCLAAGGVLVALGGGGGGAGYGGTKVAPSNGINTGFSFQFSINTPLNYAPVAGQTAYILTTGPATPPMPKAAAAPASAASLAADVAAASFVGLGAPAPNATCTDPKTLQVQGPLWGSQVLQSGSVSPYLAASGPVFPQGSEALMLYSSPVYWPGQGVNVSNLGIMPTTGPNAGNPLAANQPFYGTSQYASNSSMAHGFAQQNNTDGSTTYFLAAATANNTPAAWAYSHVPGGSTLNQTWMWGSSWPVSPNSTMNVTGVSPPVIAPNGAVLVAYTLGANQWATTGLAPAIVALHPTNGSVLYTMNQGSCTGCIPSTVQSIFTGSSPQTLGNNIVFVATYQNSTNGSIGVGLITLNFAGGSNQPLATPPAVVTQPVGPATQAYYTSTFGSKFSLIPLPGASTSLLVVNGSSYGTSLGAAIWEATSGAAAPTSVVAWNGFPGSVPQVDGDNQLIYLLSNLSTIATFSYTPAGNVSQLSNQSVANLDQKSTLLSFGSSLVLVPSLSRKQMMLIISTTIPSYAANAKSGAAVLGAYPMNSTGVMPPTPGANSTAGSYCVLGVYGAYASPGAAWQPPAPTPSDGSLVVQFSQQLSPTNATVVGYTVV